MRRHASAIGLVMAFSLSQGAALADPLTGDQPLSLAAPAAAGPAADLGTALGPAGILPVATVPPEATPPARAAPDPAERSERSRVLSYIILQGLQGAGPFAGAR